MTKPFRSHFCPNCQHKGSTQVDNMRCDVYLCTGPHQRQEIWGEVHEWPSQKVIVRYGRFIKGEQLGEGVVWKDQILNGTTPISMAAKAILNKES